MVSVVILLLTELCFGVVRATSVQDNVSTATDRINIRTYSGYNRQYVSYTSHGTLVIIEQDPLEFTSSSDTSITSSGITTSPTPTNSPSTIEKAGSSSLVITSLHAIPPLACRRPEKPDNKSTNARFESISCCDNLHSQWSASFSSFREQFDSSSLLFTSWEVKSFRTNHFTVAKCDGPFTTLCDGVVRAMCSPSTPQPALELQSASGYLSSQIKPWPAVTTPFPVPRPECVISPAECAGLWEHMADNLAIWSKSHGFHDGWSNKPTPENSTDPEVPSEPEPDVQNPQCYGSERDACLRCGFHSETVQLLYWNVEEVDEAFLCKADNDTSIQEASIKVPEDPLTTGGAMTAKWGTFTLTSPTVYAFYTTMKDEGGCGSTHTSVLIPIEPTEVSTMVWRSETDYAPFVSRVDWRHFAFKTQGSLSYPLIPRSAYCGDHRQALMDEKCNTIFHDYRPGLDFRIAGDVLGRVDPAWRYCRNGQQMAFDPPIALHPTERIAIPSLPAPEPAVTGNSLLPAATQPGPFPMVTSPPGHSDNSPEPAVFGGVQGGAPNSIAFPGVTVSKVSLVTIYASPAERRPISGGSDDPVFKASGFGDQQIPTGTGRDSFIGAHKQPDQAVITIAGRKYTAYSLPAGEGFELNGSTMLAGGKPITVDGVAVSAFKGGVVTGPDVGNGFTDLDRSSSGAGKGSRTSKANTISATDEIDPFTLPSGSDSSSRHGLAASTTTRKKSGAVGKSRLLSCGLYVVWSFCLIWSVLLH